MQTRLTSSFRLDEMMVARGNVHRNANLRVTHSLIGVEREKSIPVILPVVRSHFSMIDLLSSPEMGCVLLELLSFGFECRFVASSFRFSVCFNLPPLVVILIVCNIPTFSMS